MGMVRLPLGPWTWMVALRAARATFMSEGLVAMQVAAHSAAALAPRMAWMRLKPLRAAQPEPGLRLLQAGKAVSMK